MRFINNPNLDVNGTSLMGHVNATYDELVELFGQPVPFEVDKSTAEWRLDFTGRVVTVYDYYTSGVTHKPYDWHVGGFSPNAVDLIDEAIAGHRKSK